MSSPGLVTLPFATAPADENGGEPEILQLVPDRRNDDLLTFLYGCGAYLECLSGAELKISFPKGRAIPFDTLHTAAAFLQRCDPNGQIEIRYDAGFVVRMLPVEGAI